MGRFFRFLRCKWGILPVNVIDGGKLQQPQPYPGDCPSRELERG